MVIDTNNVKVTGLQCPLNLRTIPILKLEVLLAATLGWDVCFAFGSLDAFRDMEDEVLMRWIAKESEEAFGELFERWKRPLISYFYRSLNDYGLAEDLTLDVARKVFAARDRYRPTAKFSTWIFQIAHNRLRDEFRRSSRRPRLVQQPEEWHYPADVEPDPRKRRDQEEWLGGAIGTLSESARAVLLLNLQQGFEPSEIADILKITPNHARVLLHKARHDLRTKWKEDYE